MIRRLELKNFKTHGRRVVEFREGVNFIYGPNGSGKTSIMEAVAVALFGSGWVRRYGSTWGAYVKRGETSGEVRLELAHRGETVVVVRKFSVRGGSEAYLEIGGRRVATGDEDVTRELVARLGFSVEEFRHLLYVRQGELRAIIQKPEYLDRVLRLDEFDKTMEVVRDVKRELEKAKARMGGRLEELERRLGELVRAVEELKRRLGEAERRLAEVEVDAAKYLEVERRYREVEVRHASAREELENLGERYREQVESLIQFEEEIEKANRELEAIRAAKLELQTLPHVGDVEGEYFNLKRDVEEAGKIPPEVRQFDPKTLEVARSTYVEAVERRESVKSRLDFLRDVVNVVRKSGGGKCPVCGAPLSPDAIRHRVEEVSQLESQLELASREVERWRRELEKLESLEKLRQRYSRYLSIDLGEAVRRLAELEAQYRQKREVEQRRAHLTALVSREWEVTTRLRHYAEKKSEIEKKIAELEERMRQVEREAKAAALRLAELEPLYRQLKPRYEEYLKAQTLVGELKNMLREREREGETLRGEVEKLKREVERLEGAVETADRIHDVLKRVKPLARQIFLNFINRELAAVFLKLRHKPDFKLARLIESDGRYTVEVDTPAGSIDFPLLSLGEQNLVALSLRVALTQALLGSAPLLMLDEPTEHLDEKHRRGIVELVRELSASVPMVVVTSHLGEFEEVADWSVDLPY